MSTKSWTTSYLSLPNDDPIVSAFQLLGEGCSQATRSCPKKCGPSCSIQLRGVQLPYQLCVGNCSRNLEGEKPPPTRETLMRHILRTNIVATRDKSYTTPHPCVLPLEEMDGCLPGTNMSQSGVSTNQH